MRHYYNYYKLHKSITDNEGSNSDSKIVQSSIFTFEKKVKKTTPLALFTDENREHIRTLIAEERDAKDLPTTQNPKLYN